MTILPWDGSEIDLPRTLDKLDEFRMPNTAASLNILLLERVGEPITIGYGAAKEELA